jgi:hypothetical protein
VIARKGTRHHVRLAFVALALMGVPAVPLAATANGLPDLVPFTPAGWSAPVVVRSTTGATGSNAIDSPQVPGDATVYYNSAFTNTGTSSSSSSNDVAWLDGAVAFVGAIGAMPAGSSVTRLDWGFLTRGGLHTIDYMVDANDTVVELSESNNHFARQISFTPVTLPIGTQVTRSAPPPPLAGTTPITGAIYSNQDAVRVQTDLAWEVVALSPPPGEDYDLSLYDASTSISTGFRVPLASSSVGVGATDFVINNGNFAGSPPHDAGIVYYAGTFKSYGIEHRQAVGAVLSSGTSLTGLSLAANQMVEVRQYQHVPNASAPRITFEITGAPSVVLHIALFSGTTTYASRASALASAASDAFGHAVIDVPLPTSGGVSNYGVVVYRDQNDGGTAPANYTLRVRATGADLANDPHAGNTAPVNASNGASNWTTDPTALDGNTNNSNISFYFNNSGAATATTYRVDTRLDGLSILPFSPGAIAPGATIFQAVAPFTVRGGRHTLSYALDIDNNIDETNENNNVYGRQFVWSPQVLTAGVTLQRPLPPDPLGGLEAIPGSVARYFNCDGLRTDPAKLGGPNSLANVVAVLPFFGADVDIDAFPLSTGPLNGFATPLTTSLRGPDQTDLVVNASDLATPAMDVGVRRYAGTSQSYAIQNVFSTWTAAIDPPSIGPDAVTGNNIVKAFSFQRNVHPTMTVILDNLSGDADLGMSIYQYSSAGPHSITETLPGGYVDAVGPGVSEGTVVTTSGGLPYFAIVVWKTGWSEFPKTATFRLRIDPVTADVASALPREIAFVIAGDNPMAAGTKLRFDLPKAAPVALDVLDLQGRRVRSLTNGMQSAGSHTLAFEGTNDAGQKLRDGAYFVRFVSGSVTRVRKLVVLH